MEFVLVGLNPGWNGSFSTIKMGTGLHKRLVMHSTNKHQPNIRHHTMNTTILKINDIRQFMKNSRLRKIFRPQRDKVRETGDKCMMRRFMICAAHQIQST
jgi:hypothetical protein